MTDPLTEVELAKIEAAFEQRRMVSWGELQSLCAEIRRLWAESAAYKRAKVIADGREDREVDRLRARVAELEDQNDGLAVACDSLTTSLQHESET